MLRIGEFSQLAQISIRTLRLYDEMGLFKPAQIDRFTEYRYYNVEQLPRLNRILALKDLGLSLFNYTTWLDRAMFITMGAGITSMWAIDAIALVLLMRERMQSRAMTMALRFGMLIALIGMALAFTMTGPNGAQIAALQVGQKLSILGAHNVNVLVDEQMRMIPFLGWNRDGGDLRIAHFIGLHAIQIIPLLALWLERRRLRWLGDNTRAVLITVASATYLSVTLLTLWQALRNESIASPRALTLGGVAVVLSLAIAATATIIVRAHADDTRARLPSL